jgi:ketosteroid isomerase-like protein
MTMESREATAEALISELIQARAKAVHDKDVDALLSHHAPDVLAFDVLNPLQYVGDAAVRERAEKWLSLYPGSVGYEIRDLNVTAGGGVAFCHYLYHVTGTLSDGGKVDMWVRATTCLRQIDDMWMIVHEHQSVPFDIETGKASLNLKP